MKLKHLILVTAVSLLNTEFTSAGNPDRAGQAGATELLINPWARSVGMGSSNAGSVRGLESFHLNVAGLGFTDRTEMIFSRTNYLKGTEIHINNFGFAQRMGEGSVIGLSVFSMDLGDNRITTVEQPDGQLGFFSPRFLNIGLGYSKKFSNNIHAGVLLRLISEAISDVRAQGACLDAGVQYHTSFTPAKERVKGKDIHFGVSIRNIGPDMKFGGSGLSVSANNISTNITQNLEQRAASFNLPSLVNIGATYDIRLDKDSMSYKHKLAAAFTFVSNTFQNNQYALGLEYSYKDMVMLRTGYVFEEDIFSKEQRKTVFTGLNAGFGVQIPINKTGTLFGIDYGYRATDPFDGVHVFAARLSLGSKQ